MKEIVLQNAKKKFDEARETCPGMSWDLYYLTDFISLMCSNNLTPKELSVFLVLVYDALRDGENVFDEPEFNNLLVNRWDVLNEIYNSPQVVDVIANNDFSKEFRGYQQEFYGIVPPIRVHKDSTLPYPESVIVAVNWWAKKMQEEYFKNYSVFFSSARIFKFRERLAKIIAFDLQSNRRSIIYCENEPCFSLISAGLELGLDVENSDFPKNIEMYIDNSTVKVLENSNEIILWSIYDNETDDEIKKMK